MEDTSNPSKIPFQFKDSDNFKKLNETKYNPQSHKFSEKTMKNEVIETKIYDRAFDLLVYDEVQKLFKSLLKI